MPTAVTERLDDQNTFFGRRNTLSPEPARSMPTADGKDADDEGNELEMFSVRSLP